MFNDKKQEEHVETAIEAGFAKAGLRRIDYEMAAAALALIKKGETREAYIAAWDRAAASVKESSTIVGPLGSGMSGAIRAKIAPSRPFTEHELKKKLAEIKQKRTRRETEIKAKAAAIEERIVRRFIDTRLMPDGRKMGDVKGYEIGAQKRMGALFAAIAQVVGPLNSRQQNQSLRELMTDDQFKRAVEMAEAA